MAYADDITLFSTNDLHNLIDVCVVYSKMWRFGVEKSKCVIVGKCSLYQDPKWRLGDKCLCNEESLNILGNVFNRGGNNASHVINRQNADSHFMGLVMPVCYTQEPLLLFKRICINV